MTKPVRVRFAPSPTGGLHLGGVRTALYNYLFAKKHNGTFVLRIEDTDQTRYVEGAEQYILACLQWCGIMPDEGVHAQAQYGPYRQSERKELYKKYALQLVQQGNAYYAFDTSEALEQMRADLQTDTNPTPQYDKRTRASMKNSLSLPEKETQKLLEQNTPYVIRIKVPENETVTFDDIIRGTISNDSNLLDDKVLLKADGMPTYHLAVVVDDYLMQISHAFRGEEWLPSAPIHILLWNYLFGIENMPQWAHLPLILKPDGHGKLSKRDGERLGFPVFAINWKDPKTLEQAEGFKERGFVPEAFINMLALLGWNTGTEQEIFTKEELIQYFDLARVHKGGAKFDFERAKYFNHEWIKKIDAATLAPLVKEILLAKNTIVDNDTKLHTIINMVKERCVVLNDFYEQCTYFYNTPEIVDIDSIKSKWNEEKKNYFTSLIPFLQEASAWDTTTIETIFKEHANACTIKIGELQLPFRIMLVGAKYGPGVFDIANIIGKENTITRIHNTLSIL